MKKGVPSCLGYIVDYTTQLYGEYNITIIRILFKQPRIQWKVSEFFFFRGSVDAGLNRLHLKFWLVGRWV